MVEQITKNELETRKEQRRKAIEADRAKAAQALQDQLVRSNLRRQAEWAERGPKLTERKNERREKRMKIAQEVIEMGRRNRSTVADDDVETLRAKAEASGVAVDKRWGVDRLKTEIAKAEGA